MNNKAKILDAWITVEQLSEGDINRKKKEYRQFLGNQYLQELQEFAVQYQEKLKPKERKYSGLVLYFGIFPFQETLEQLRHQYRLKPTDEELTVSDKFTFALYFDHQFNFIQERFFYTMSGHIRQKGILPDDFRRIEVDLADLIEKQIQDKGFNIAFTMLLQKYGFSSQDCRFSFIKNLANADKLMHSHFFKDLKYAKQVTTPNLERYLQGFSGSTVELDSNKKSSHQVFSDILAPQNYPMGRFPGNKKHPLSMMQQIAVNLSLNDKNDIQSVNGPPGTGKTTLLKDIFADLIVQQANTICHLGEQTLKASVLYSSDKNKVAPLPLSIASKGIVVASSNNGAVQNIVKELPQYKLDEKSDFLEDLIAVDYFNGVANDTKDSMVNWGMLSAEGGNSKNLEQLEFTLHKMLEELNSEEFIPNPKVYQEFKHQYSQLNQKRQNVQAIANEVASLPNLVKKQQALKKELEERSLSYQEQLDRYQNELQILTLEKERLETQLVIRYEEQQKLFQEQLLAQQAVSLLKLQSPPLFWLKKLFFPTQVADYLNELQDISEHLQQLVRESSSVKHTIAILKEKQVANEKQIILLEKQYAQSEASYQEWLKQINKKYHECSEEIVAVQRKVKLSGIKVPDFSLSHEELQKSQFWFDDSYRYEQSQLFIKALAVRKQFLYDNKENVKAGISIWTEQWKYLTKENAQELFQIAWDWVNFTIPIISTTFASFGRMFKNLSVNSIGHLFIDEAGQALPQASVGAIMRSKRIFVVGDPSQIQPVLTLDSQVLGLIARHYSLTERYISPQASTQSLVDATSQYGFTKLNGTWIGIPLWVHRRSKDPMFKISNTISYDGLMVQGKTEEESKGKGGWKDVSGSAIDKYVVEQAKVLKTELVKRQKISPTIFDDIFVITPFKNVAQQLAKELRRIGFTKYNDNKPTNVGTVHTFQGKEAKIVYFVLGADNQSRGAANWFASQANIMNVAATRAKEEFYIIGNKTLYKSLNSSIITDTINILDNYENKDFNN
ncbi:ATP-binding protein [Streptococcus chenjunshii]|uniref:ATP-binding protein n=1 Tax=Streptococcus chenjunshii TaxID=2173853 RepID=A0A372KMD3_9STRE|nr:AAA domain-containing protein [Streptococcus chenjunshii]AXQ78167.1 ATP-binding protein [Streptococcus chenjunshii]RFU50688.1 ATP-binding protein [Streptococcus chenjunshii]RFU53460.1 ATP-binding protein [Streptococcus chenjunshii]